MDIKNILKDVNDIFIDVLDNESIVLSDKTTAKDIEEWDSLNHIQLIVAIEKHFKIRFASFEVMGFKDVGGMCEVIQQKLEL